jgi:hypothetical protein
VVEIVKLLRGADRRIYVGRRDLELQAGLRRLFPPMVRSALAVAVTAAMATIWMATAGTETLALKNAAPPMQSAHRLPHGSTFRSTGALGSGMLPRVRNGLLGDNWSGYVLTGGPYTAAEGTWTVPAVSYVPYAGSPPIEMSSTWIGIDGYGESQLIQLGTEEDVTSSNVAIYRVWYELLPEVETIIDASRFVVGPGDTITASMRCTANCTPNARATWVLSMMNVGRWRTPFAIQVQYSSPLATAEWVEEATCIDGCRSTPADYSYLPNYGSTSFVASTLNGANPNFTPRDSMLMTDPNGKAWSVPSVPTGGNSFSVRFVRP